MVRFVKAFGEFLPKPTRHPALDAGPRFLSALRLRKAAGPRVKHGATASLVWKADIYRDRGLPMRYFLFAFAASAAFALPAQAEPSLERGFDGALRGCEEWLLNPASWVDGTGPFVKAVGLGEQMGLVEGVEEVTLPPKQMRKANHYWRIDSTSTAGYVLVVSDQLPMCHITGGGGTDVQPSLQSVLLSPAFIGRWEQLETSSRRDMATTVYRHRRDPALSIIISRAKQPGERLDRVQVLATATYQTGN